jgi:hypothetical protein
MEKNTGDKLNNLRYGTAQGFRMVLETKGSEVLEGESRNLIKSIWAINESINADGGKATVSPDRLRRRAPCCLSRGNGSGSFRTLPSQLASG